MFRLLFLLQHYDKTDSSPARGAAHGLSRWHLRGPAYPTGAAV